MWGKDSTDRQLTQISGSRASLQVEVSRKLGRRTRSSWARDMKVVGEKGKRVWGRRNHMIT